MIRSKLGLKVLGLCAMLVGMFAFTGVAQAEVGAFWLVSGAKISEALLPTVEAKTDVEGSLLTTLGGKEIHLRCPNIKLVGAHLVEPLGKILGKIDFSGCKFFTLEGSPLSEKEKTACEPSAEGVKGLIVTNNITGLIKLHEGQPVIEAVPTEAKKPFVNLFLGEECGFGENLKVGGPFEGAGGGVVFLKDCQGKALTDLAEHLVEELSALTKLTVNGGATAATVHGSAWAFLGGAHKGLTFAAHAA